MSCLSDFERILFVITCCYFRFAWVKVAENCHERKVFEGPLKCVVRQVPHFFANTQRKEGKQLKFQSELQV